MNDNGTRKPKSDAEIRDALRQRVMDAFANCGIPQADVVRATGADKSRVSRWATGAEVPGEKYLPRLPDALRISGHWLLTGEGDMRPAPPETESEAFREMAAIVDRVRATPPSEKADALARGLPGKRPDETKTGEAS